MKYLLYSMLGLAAIFAGTMAYLAYFATPVGEINFTGQESLLSKVVGSVSPVTGRSRTLSGRAGKVRIVYAGDIAGRLDPCG